MLPPPRANPHAAICDPDASIRATDSDAAQARISAVRKQYLRDPFIYSFIQRPHLVPTRPPIINIGTYLRSEAIDKLVIQWLTSVCDGGEKAQIVSLGAGSDTRFWRLVNGLLGPGDRVREILARYLEVDFSENSARKVTTIRQKSELGSVVGEFAITDSTLTSDIYAIRDVDLRGFHRHFSELVAPKTSNDHAQQRSRKPLLDTSLPILVIAECVFPYMDQSQSDALIRWFADTFSVVGAVVYEMFGLNDNFGRVMKENLKARNVALPGVDAYPTLDSQCGRFLNHGFTTARALSLRTIRNQYISGEERRRITQLEWLDEIEELDLLLDHYVIAWASKKAVRNGRAEAETLASWALKDTAAPGNA